MDTTTLGQAMEAYNRKKTLAEKTMRKNHCLLRLWYGDSWKDQQVLAISSEEIESKYLEHEPGGKETAIHTRRLVKRLISFTKDILLKPQTYYSKPPILRQVWIDYQRIRPLKESTISSYERTMSICFEDWLDKPITEIKKKAIIQRYSEVSERAPYLASLAMRSLRALFNFAIHFYEDKEEHPLVQSNPVESLSKLRAWNKVDRARSIIYRHQLPDWLRGVLSLRYDTTRDYILFLWLTGCRPGEAASLKWEDVDIAGGMVTLKGTKNGTDHIIPVCSFIWDMLKSRKLKVADVNGYVFPGKVYGNGICNNRKGYRNMCERLGVAWKHYDLRRGYATMASSLDLPFSTIQRLLNHSDRANVTMGYVIHDPETLRPAVENIAMEFLRLANYDHKARSVSLKSHRIEAHSPAAIPLLAPNSVSLVIANG